jgi:hypothetical protein
MSSRWQKFAKLERSKQLLILEAVFNLLVAMLIVRFIPFRWWKPVLGAIDRETTLEDSNTQRETITQIGKTIHAISSRFSGRFTCLMQALTGQMMLNRRGISSTLYLGVLTLHNSQGIFEVKAHAWLRTGSIILVGKQGYQQFEVISRFATGQSI